MTVIVWRERGEMGKKDLYLSDVQDFQDFQDFQDIQHLQDVTRFSDSPSENTSPGFLALPGMSRMTLTFLEVRGNGKKVILHLPCLIRYSWTDLHSFGAFIRN